MSILCLLHHLLQSIAQILNRFPFRRSLSTRSTLCMASVCDGERQNRRLWLLWKTKNYARRNSDQCQIRPWLSHSLVPEEEAIVLGRDRLHRESYRLPFPSWDRRSPAIFRVMGPRSYCVAPSTDVACWPDSW